MLPRSSYPCLYHLSCLLLLPISLWKPVAGFTSTHTHLPWKTRGIFHRQPLQFPTGKASNDDGSEGFSLAADSFDGIVKRRTACKKYQRYQNSTTVADASISNPSVVQTAFQCLQIAQQAPSAFNTQPYKVVLVSSPEQKQKLSRYALGPNCKRVLDSDCTAVFLADREVVRGFPKYLQFMQATQKRSQPISRYMKLQLLLYITLFSSGYPLPRFLAAPISFLVRTAMAIASFFSQWFYVLPTFSGAETWTTKQCLLMAMTYMLACTSRGLATCPMEGINAAGIRGVLGVPRRYSIPLIVTTGMPYDEKRDTESKVSRYPSEEMIFGDRFGQPGLATSTCKASQFGPHATCRKGCSIS